MLSKTPIILIIIAVLVFMTATLLYFFGKVPLSLWPGLSKRHAKQENE
jgi:uncharacterized protein YqfA (UPF0365 family)